VIVDSGQVVYDSPRILRYLEDRHPDPALFPPEGAQRAEVDLFIEWFDRVWKLAPNQIADELERSAPNEARVADLAAELDRHLDLFDGLLTDRQYMLRDALSAADFIAFPFLKYARGREPEDDELFHRLLDEHQGIDGRAHLAAWIERIDGLPRA
jgi:glutathione S-transferase